MVTLRGGQVWALVVWVVATGAFAYLYIVLGQVVEPALAVGDNISATVASSINASGNVSLVGDRSATMRAGIGAAWDWLPLPYAILSVIWFWVTLGRAR